MTKTDKTYFGKLKNDLIHAAYRYNLANMDTITYEESKNLYNEWSAHIGKYFDRILHNYEDLGLITRDECLTSLLNTYNELIKAIDAANNEKMTV